jgi:hypothetical protein
MDWYPDRPDFEKAKVLIPGKMISKICTGHSFYGSIRYVCQEGKQAEILGFEGVRGYSKKLMIEDFQRQHGLRPEKKQACFHGILSFYPGEKLSDAQILAVAQKYLAGLNIKDTQYAVVKHTDKAHLHVHLIANMVDNNGQSISDGWIALRGKKQAQKLTLEYKLTQGLTKRLSRTTYENLREPEQYQYKIYAAVKHHLRNCRSMDQLKERLQPLGIEMEYKYKGHTGEKQGISFRLGEYCFKGSKIDRQFSYANLEKAFSMTEKRLLTIKIDLKNPENVQRLEPKSSGGSQRLAREVTYQMNKMLEILLSQEEDYEQTSYELTQEAERKRQQHLNH